ncbi:MAG: hypothetical protein MIO93_07290 [ANME-2 cluster archaeon]|nr:hypothetical protein [ANME-2 cluster archaeon]
MNGSTRSNPHTRIHTIRNRTGYDDTTGTARTAIRIVKPEKAAIRSGTKPRFPDRRAGSREVEGPHDIEYNGAQS